MNRKTILKLSGLSCAVCASKVEDALSRLQGVKRASVNLAASIAVVDFDPDLVDGSRLVDTVTALGYGAKAEDQEDEEPGESAVAILHIGGMSCSACAAKVEKALSALSGVDSAVVNFAAATARLKFDPARTGIEEIERAVTDAGYSVRGIDVREEGREGSALSRSHGDDDADDEVKDLKRRLIVGAVLSVPLFVLSMPGLFPLVGSISWQLRAWFLLALTLPVQFYVGWPFLKNAWLSARHHTADMNTLVAVGTLSAFFYSLSVTLLPHIFLEAGLSLHLYYDSASMIIVFVLLGRLLERRARQQAAGAIRKLLTLTPSIATLLENGRERQVPVSVIRPGDVLKVGPSQAVPVDGVVVEGESEVDESMLTGESAPVEKGPGSKLIAGTLNLWGVLVMQAQKVGSETVLAGIVRVVQEAQGSKAAIQRLADRVASVFVPVVITAALAAGAVWYFTGPEPRITNALVTFVTVMVIACPCAMGLATPAAVMAGTGRGAERGILIKNARSVEQAAGITVVCFDKTGTLTQGKPSVTDIIPAGNSDEASLLKLAAALEMHSEHPIASAVVQEAQGRVGEASFQAGAFRAVPGKGVKGRVITTDGLEVDAIVGTRSFVLENGIDISMLDEEFRRLSSEGKSVVWVAADGMATGLVALADTVRDEASDAVHALREMGLKVMMLTGDNAETARSVAITIGLDDFEAGILPGEKAEYIKRLQEQGSRVAMVGDGVNDAPALVQADVGIAMGSGTDIAMDAADIGLMRENLMAVPEALSLVRQTLRIIKQNLFWAFAYNTLAIPVAAGVLYPFWGIRLSPVFAAAAMAMSSVTVVANALRLRYAGSEG